MSDRRYTVSNYDSDYLAEGLKFKYTYEKMLHGPRQYVNKRRLKQ